MMTVGIRYFCDRDKPELPAESAHTPQLGWSSQRPRGQWTHCRTARSIGLRRARAWRRPSKDRAASGGRGARLNHEPEARLQGARRQCAGASGNEAGAQSLAGRMKRALIHGLSFCYSVSTVFLFIQRFFN